MKVRFTDEQIRMRVRRSDVQQLRDTHSCSCNLPVAGGPLSFSLVLSTEVAEPSIVWETNRLKVVVPMQQGTTWIDSHQVGMRQSVGTPPVEVLIEKDFPCKHQPDEHADADTFSDLMEG